MLSPVSHSSKFQNVRIFCCYYCCYYCAWLCGSEIPSLPYGVSVRPKEVLLGQTSGFAQLRDWRFRGGECLQLGGHPFPCVPRYTLWLGSSLISPYGYQKGIHSNFLSSLGGKSLILKNLFHSGICGKGMRVAFWNNCLHFPGIWVASKL